MDISKKVGFILDCGYFSKQNIEHMDKCGYSFTIMAKYFSTRLIDYIFMRSGLKKKKG